MKKDQLLEAIIIFLICIVVGGAIMAVIISILYNWDTILWKLPY